MSISSHLIRGTPVSFPFDPYPSQLVFIERTIQALQEQKDALLESPTGTGKTICLLAAALAWRAECAKTAPENTAVPRIFYASRTHTQLAKVIAELAGSPYEPYMTVLGSRQQLCIHEKVSRAPAGAKNAMCRSLVSANKCSHHEAVQPHVARTPHPKQVADIEDLLRSGRASGACPYYVSRERTKTSEITFLPYNYLIDPSVRRMMAESLDGAVLIFDEAHNLDSVCADASSFDLSSTHMTDCIKTLQYAVQEGLVSRDVVARLERLVEEFGAIQTGSHPGALLPTAFERAGITMPVAEELSEALESASPTLTQSGVNTTALQAVISCLRIVFAAPLTLNETPMSVSHHYRLNVSQDRVISYWCFHPGIALRVLRAQHGVRCILLASGTLSPMDALASELGSPFPVRLENPHVIRADQLWAGVVSCGPGSIRMDNSYNNRGNAQHLRDLGNAIVNFARMVPDGLLVFFPSYAVLEACLQAWQRPGESVWGNIAKYKRIIQEPREQARCNAAMAEFEKLIAEPNDKGVIFFAVCRGKVAEGLDFKDRNGRAVVIVGIPFPSAADAKVVAKKRFLDTNRRTNTMLLSGDDWYQQQAACAVNQAVGRVIRHRFDFGAMIFLDWRFEKLLVDSNKPFLSTWIRPYVKNFSEFGQATISLSRFFAKAPKIVKELRDAAEEEARKSRLTHGTTTLTTADASRKRSALRDIEPAPASATPLQKDSKQQKQEKARRFIELAKESLGANHATFQQSLRKYKSKDTTIQRVIQECLPLFMAVQDENVRRQLLEGFESFIPPKHHAEFRAMVTGTPDIRPSSALENAPLAVPSLASPSTVGAPSRPILVGQPKRDTEMEEMIRARAAAKAADEERLKREQEEARSKAPQPGSASLIVVNSVSPVSTPPEAAAPTPAPAAAPAAPKLSCPICLDALKQPFSSNCGHICCYGCWQSWLDEKLECPVCKARCRMKQLKKIYFS